MLMTTWASILPHMEQCRHFVFSGVCSLTWSLTHTLQRVWGPFPKWTSRGLGYPSPPRLGLHRATRQWSTHPGHVILMCSKAKGERPQHSLVFEVINAPPTLLWSSEANGGFRRENTQWALTGYICHQTAKKSLGLRNKEPQGIR